VHWTSTKEGIFYIYIGILGIIGVFKIFKLPERSRSLFYSGTCLELVKLISTSPYQVRESKDATKGSFGPVQASSVSSTVAIL